MIPYGMHHIDEDDIQAVVSVLKCGALTQGPLTEKFEAELAEYVGAKYAVAVSSGTAALHLASLAGGVKVGTNSITSPITFVASANAARYAQGDVSFSDIETDTINMSPDELELALGEHINTKVVIPVHFAGLPCDMKAIKLLADKAGAIIIEDAAHALGARYPDGSRVGSCKNSLMTIFSFHPVKAIAAGEGGMITTNDLSIYRKLLRLRSHGINKLDDPLQKSVQAFTGDKLNPWYYEMQELGFHYRITEIQCALALSQLKKLNHFIERRQYLAKRYDQLFQNFKNCKPAQKNGRDNSAHHIYVLRVDFSSIGLERATLMTMLKEKGIGTQVHYIPVPMHPYYSRDNSKIVGYPNAIDYYRQALTIPLFYDLTENQQDFIVEVFREFVG